MPRSILKVWGIQVNVHLQKYGVIQHSLNKTDVSRYEALKGGAIGVTNVKLRSLGTRSVYRLQYVLYIIAKRKSLSFNF